MQDTYWIDWFSLPVVFLLTVLFTLTAIYSGAKLCKYVQHEDSNATGPIVGATVGLLAFVLAFTFNMAASRYDARKQLLLEEVNTINTSYLRADLLDKSYQEQAKILLRRYVEIRIELLESPEKILEKIEASESIQRQLWSMITQMNEQELISASQRLFIQSLNKMFDLQTRRIVVGEQTRIPSTIWLGLYLIAALAMIAVGYQFGYKQRSTIYINLVLAMAFSAVLTLIADLDRAVSGTVELNQQPMIDLNKKLRNDI